MHLRPSPENIEAARALALSLWRERAASRLEPEPADLSDSCKFSALIAKALFGGAVCGNERHFFCRTDDGTIIDLNEHAADVQAIRAVGRDPYRHDARFMARMDVREALKSCQPRVDRWLALYHISETKLAA